MRVVEAAAERCLCCYRMFSLKRIFDHLPLLGTNVGGSYMYRWIRSAVGGCCV